mgnify:CR=1 FL=1
MAENRSKGRFGVHGGQYIPETLMNAVIELEEAYNHYKNDPEFNAELQDLFNNYAGRPSRLYYAKKMTEDLGGAKIYLKREDLNHTGAHKINNVLGQVCLFRGRPQPRYLLSIKPTGEDRSLVPLGEELARAVPLNMLPATGTTTAPLTLSLNSLPDCVFHTLHEFSHIRHCIFAVFFYQLHDSGSYDDTI